MKAYERKGKKASTMPTNLLGQLLFREMYFGAQAALGYAFAQTVGNTHCRFIPWHLPSTVSPSSGLITGTYTISSPLHERWFQRWKHGRTGFPWIDALMRQLKQEGWIHHLGRHAVACFLTRGGCYVDWERGAEVFEEWLIDHEVACNSGNWQWLACVAFYAQFYRCYSPIAFPKKTDKEGAFVKHFLPELEGYPAKYIYEPWKAPIQDQKRAGCLIKGDGEGEGEEGGTKIYPKPMFDFNERRGICIEGVKNAYRVGLHGDDESVRNGSWRELFPDDAEGPTEGTGGVTKGKVREIDGGVGGSEGKESLDNVGEEEKVKEGAKGGREGKGRDLGVDEDEDEARELGGETKGGDHISRSPGKRKRKQATLDGVVERGAKRGRR
jgi:cryptochrome